jgi:hypothetical protein
MTPDDLRAAIRAELLPIRTQLEALSGLPKTVQDLIDQSVRLTDSAHRLEQRADEQGADVRSVERTLSRLAPVLDRFAVITDHALPELVRRLEKLSDDQLTMKDEIHLEISRAAGAKP